jgi:transaldolase
MLSLFCSPGWIASEKMHHDLTDMLSGAALYAAHQALTAISAGVDYAAPYVGRINDLSGDVRPPRLCLAQFEVSSRMVM